MLRVLGHGLCSVLCTAEQLEATGPSEWRFLTIAIDQGSDGWCAVFYLCYVLQACIVFAFDPSHRSWNDTAGSLKDAGLHGVILLLIIIMNMDHGPWKEARWYQTGVEGAKGYKTKTNHKKCAVFQENYPKMCVDLAEVHRMGEVGHAGEMFDRVEESFARSTRKIAMNRWLGFVHTAIEFIAMWQLQVGRLRICLGVDR